MRKQERAAEQRHFESGRIRGVTHQPVPGSQCDRIGRAGRGNSHRSETLPPEVLHSGEQAGHLHLNYSHAGIGLKRTRSPIDSLLMSLVSAWNMARGVRPINRQPPGVGKG